MTLSRQCLLVGTDPIDGDVSPVVVSVAVFADSRTTRFRGGDASESAMMTEGLSRSHNDPVYDPIEAMLVSRD